MSVLDLDFVSRHSFFSFALICFNGAKNKQEKCFPHNATWKLSLCHHAVCVARECMSVSALFLVEQLPAREEKKEPEWVESFLISLISWAPIHDVCTLFWALLMSLALECNIIHSSCQEKRVSSHMTQVVALLPSPREILLFTWCRERNGMRKRKWRMRLCLCAGIGGNKSEREKWKEWMDRRKDGREDEKGQNDKGWMKERMDGWLNRPGGGCFGAGMDRNRSTQTMKKKE